MNEYSNSSYLNEKWKEDQEAVDVIDHNYKRRKAAAEKVI
jgi:hypothetical protein